MSKGIKHIHSEEDIQHTKYEVYILVCPINKTIKYIGCSQYTKTRYVQHLSEFKFNKPFERWRNKLKKAKKTPILKIIASFKTKTLALLYEDFLIRNCKDTYNKTPKNIPLINVNEELNNLI